MTSSQRNGWAGHTYYGQLGVQNGPKCKSDGDVRSDGLARARARERHSLPNNRYVNATLLSKLRALFLQLVRMFWEGWEP